LFVASALLLFLYENPFLCELNTIAVDIYRELLSHSCCCIFFVYFCSYYSISYFFFVFRSSKSMDWNGVVEMFITSLSPNFVSNASRMYRVSLIYLFFERKFNDDLKWKILLELFGEIDEFCVKCIRIYLCAIYALEINGRKSANNFKVINERKIGEFISAMSLLCVRTQQKKQWKKYNKKNFSLHNTQVNCIISFKTSFFMYFSVYFISTRGCLCLWILKKRERKNNEKHNNLTK
jgi:hypothetical protein